MSADEEIGRRISTLMHDAGITQGAMAERMGLTQAAISRKLSGERPWFADELAAAAAILGVSVGALFGEPGKRRRLDAGAVRIPARRHKGPAVATVMFSG